jgi:hypothetical protein
MPLWRNLAKGSPRWRLFTVLNSSRIVRNPLPLGIRPNGSPQLLCISKSYLDELSEDKDPDSYKPLPDFLLNLYCDELVA